MKRIFIAICFMLIAHNTIADDQGLTISLVSKHVISNDYDYNETNLGLGYTNYFEDRTAWQVGFYDNSFDDLSVYAALKFYSYESARVNPFFMLGLVTGYEDYPIKPMMMAGIDFEIIKTHKLNVMVAPIAASAKPAGGNDYETDYGVLFALQYEKLF